MISQSTHRVSNNENSSSGSVASGNDAPWCVDIKMHGPKVKKAALWFTMLSPLTSIGVGFVGAWLVG